MSKKMRYAKPRKVNLPDQAAKQPFSIVFDHYTTSASGKRDKFLIRKEVKFDSVEDMADYYEQNCHQSHISEFYPPKEKE